MKLEENKLRAKEKAADAKKIQDLERQVCVYKVSVVDELCVRGSKAVDPNLRIARGLI